MSAIEPKPLISNDLLTELANPNYDATRGEFNTETRALLATALPEMCRELLAHRQAQDHALEQSFRNQANDQLRKARATLLGDGKSNFAIFTACNTILEHSQDATERNAATDVLAQITRAA
ncbi:hypothetical protein [Aliiroseovarius lamellibrachiae]|mgnify:CR=1 FL=1|uniref:hypothetical protein n=1 Tax=Aliiroseovarius lamellibrachiae TaxID=1924933 RepID=UPI001BDF8E41|nr:hypothetical protein [Aliiroseovarius lamellibrachiae]MBT2130096.1 hypothetical protein [Aliiroseovarius lamellibrachiae]